VRATLSLAAVSALLAAAPACAKSAEHSGTCDASAVAVLDADHFVVASDEDNTLRIYAATGGSPIAELDLDPHLGTDDEADIEAATVLGDHVFWITSHGRSKKGNLRPARYRLFATSFEKAGGAWQGAAQGTPYAGLGRDLSADPKLAALGLREAIRFDLYAPVKELAPKRSGLNIEGLAATPDGALLIGLRNPLRFDGKAILVPLKNPQAVVATGAAPEYGDPILLELDGLGIRSIEYVAGQPGTFYLLAGPKADGAVVLYRWSGAPAQPPQRLRTVAEGKAEGLAPTAGGDRLLLVSDAGDRLVDGQQCKDLRDAGLRTFRSWTAPVEGR
jgi:hypothetical protein